MTTKAYYGGIFLIATIVPLIVFMMVRQNTISEQSSEEFVDQHRILKDSRAECHTSCYGAGGSTPLQALTPDQWYHWNMYGFLYIPGFYDAERVAQLAALTDEVWANRKIPDHPAGGLTVNGYISTEGKQEFHAFMKDVDDDVRKVPYKINDLYLISDLVRETIIGGRLSYILEALLDAEPVVCNSLSFEYGSQQPIHLDTWYMPSRVMNGMIASWIAIDEVTDVNGPLLYYPGSHMIKPFSMNPEAPSMTGRIVDRQGADKGEKHNEFGNYIKEQMEKRGITGVEFKAKPGDLLIWHGNLLHGGVPIKDDMKTTRRALVTHYHSTKDYIHNSQRLMKEKSGSGFIYQKKVKLNN